MFTKNNVIITLPLTINIVTNYLSSTDLGKSNFLLNVAGNDQLWFAATTRVYGSAALDQASASCTA